MSESAPSLPEKIVAIDAALRSARVPHAIGGALALAYYGEPRATYDIDVNVFVKTESWSEIRDALAPLGVQVKIDELALDRDGQIRLWWDRTPVDLFFSYDPFHRAMEKASRKVPFAETKIPILAPEHLLVCKAMFDRAKDWPDIEQILVATEPLDVAEVRGWIERMTGTGDQRLEKLDEILERLAIEV